MSDDYKVPAVLHVLAAGVPTRVAADEVKNTDLAACPLLLGVVMAADPQPAHLALDKDDLLTLSTLLTNPVFDRATGKMKNAALVGRPALFQLARWAALASRVSADVNEVGYANWARTAPFQK